MSISIAARRRHIARTTGCGAITVEIVSLMLGFMLVIWSLTPIYNMVLIALSSHGAVFSGDIWPHDPSLEAFGRGRRRTSGISRISGTSSATASLSA